MALLAVLELTILVGSALARWAEATEQCGPAYTSQSLLRPLCPRPIDEDASPEPKAWLPWTHRPYCASSDYCVFTNSGFHGSSNYGVSFISTPEVASSSLDVLESSFSMPLAVIRDSNGTGPALYHVVDMPGKGMGVVASRKIERGSVFMVDYASIIAAVEFPEKMPRFQGHMLLDKAVEQLPDPKRVLSLARSSSTDRALMEDVMRTNAFSITLNDRPWMGLFPLISRMNHACKPNAHTRFSQRSLVMSAVSLRDIGPGEEITISYAEFGTMYGQRQHSLLHNWGFRCTCALCTAPSEELVTSDRRRGRIGEIRQEVVELVQAKKFERAISMSKEMIDLVLEEELVAHLGEHYEVLARLYYAVRDKANTDKYARLAVADLERYGGEEVYGATIGELKGILLELEQLGKEVSRPG
ncbi:SET domain-containing protein [Coniochaeta ligniaria NRRL 30616]|uniref:SET domain-containing protein n=1 Tax=Coniochaeta ligniaria NRRL 30616 TaxID=1408157 RepID=A0A1J7J2S6_9PEZI|nr:SET domain-containing protein [Coniochaeta ligniaria NRRL 30616]